MRLAALHGISISRTPDSSTGAAERSAARPSSAASRDAKEPTLRFRTDIEGLRGLGMIAVLLWHAQVPYGPGGYVALDLFFVMSGFLITGLLLREVETTGTLSLKRFFARRVRRLLPSVVVVLAFVLALTSWVVAPVFRPAIVWDVIAANFYVVNWRFANAELDYLARGGGESPVLHFWSLSVEEQFYIVWPLLLLGAALVWRRFSRGGIRATAAVPIVIVSALSLAYSIYYTEHAASAAYFSTFTRVWEFGLGAGLALVPIAALRMPGWVASAIGWGGLAALLWACVTYDEFTSFPGSAALVPAIATAAIFAAGTWNSSILLMRFLSLRPLRWVGRISYSWYLWHWPLLVFAAIAWGPLTTTERVAIAFGSVVPTLIAFHFVEEPFRRSATLARSHGLNYRLAAACTVAVAVGAALSWAAVPRVPLLEPGQAIGAQALDRGAEIQRSARAIRPNPTTAVRDRGRADADGCLVKVFDERSDECVYGHPRSKVTVVLYGDSHAMQWFPAVHSAAVRRKWRLVVLTKSACTPAEVAVYNNHLKRAYTECQRWRRHAIRRMAKERPAMVIAGSGVIYRVARGGKRLGKRTSARVLESAYVRTLRRLKNRGARVFVLRDTPLTPNDPRACVSRSLKNLERCAFSQRKAYAMTPIGMRAAARVNGVRGINSAPVFCRRGRCPAVIGNVLIYRNTAHITGTYMRTLRPWLARRLPTKLTPPR